MNRSFIIAGVLFLLTNSVMAGNPERAGQAGATELLINPWARSSGWADANSGSIRGLESIFLNVAGAAFTKNTEVIFSSTDYLQGSGIRINAFGLSQRINESSVIGLGIMSMNFGDIPVTTTSQPDGGLGTYNPEYLNMNLFYAKAFSNSIYGGINVKLVNESISNVSASGIAFDAGIQYVTGNNNDKDNIKFGISLRNVGAPLTFTGDGLSFRANLTPNGLQPYGLTVSNRSQDFEMPSLINIGASYDIKFLAANRLTIAAAFTSNSFSNDQFHLGLEYGFKTYFMLRGGFTYENNIFDSTLRTTSSTGPTAGFTVEIPFGKSGKTFGIDYSYRATDPFSGTHSLGARFNL